MLRELRCAFLTAAAIALLFSAGCVSEKEFEKARFECIELSSGAFADVPECDSQEKCFEELEQRKFGFSDESLSFEVRQELYYYKNYVSRSWFYFNLARNRAKQIQGICINGTGFELLPRLTNELNNYLVNAFEEADNANKQSLIVLALESVELENEEISKIREEALFDVKIKIHNNLNSLSGDYSGKSYYAKYLEKVREFNELSERKGFEPLTVESFGFEELVFSASQKYSKQIISVFVEKNFLVPFMADSLSSFASFLSGKNSLTESLGSLRNSPAFEFMVLYSDLLGENESVLSGFSELLKEDCVSRKFIELENKQLEESAEKKLKDAKERSSRILFEEFAFLESDSVIELSDFSGSSELSYREFEFESMEEYWQNSSEFIESLEFEFSEIKSKQLLGEISVGEKTSRLKKLNFELDELIDALEFVEKDLLIEFVAGCERKILEKNPVLDDPEFIELKLEIEQEIYRFENTESLSEKIVYCSQALELFDALNEKKTEKEKNKDNAWLEIGTCLDRLDLFSPALDEFDSKLFETVKKFKQEIDSGSFTEDTAETCYLLEETVKETLGEYFEIEEIEKDCSEAKNFVGKTRFILNKKPGMQSGSLQSLESELLELDYFFDSKKLVLEKAIETIQTVRWRCNELNRKSRGEVRALLVKFLSENVLVKASSIETIIAGKDFNAIYLIEFDNPFFSWPEPMSFSIQLNKSINGLSTKSHNIISVTQKNQNAVIELSSLPEGKSFAEFFSAGIVNFSVKTEIKEISSLKAKIKKTIEFDSKETISRIKLIVPLESGAEYGELRAFFNEQAVSVGVQKNSVVLELEEVSSEKKAFVYFSVFEPVSFTKTMLERKEIDKNKVQEKVLLLVENKLNQRIENTSLVVLFENSKFVESVELFDEQGEKKELKIIPNGLVVKAEFFPGEKKHWLLQYVINNETAYFNEKIEDLEKRLGALSVLPGLTGNKAKELLESVESIGSPEFPENKEKIRKAIDEMLKLELFEEKNQELKKEIKFIETEIEKKIELMKKEIAFLPLDQNQLNKFEKTIEKTRNTLKKAKELENNNPNEALKLIYNAQAELNDFSLDGTREKIKAEAVKVLDEISLIKEQSESLGISSVELESSSQKTRELFLDLEKFLGKKEYFSAANLLEELKEKTEKMKIEFNNLLEKENSDLAENTNKFIEKSRLVKSKIKKLQSEFSNISENKTELVQPMLSVKKALLEELEEEVNAIEKKYSDGFSSILMKLTDKKTSDALKIAKALGVKTALNEISSVEERVTKLELDLKTMALTELNNAKKQIQKLDGEGILQLEKAVNEANKNNYLNSLLLTRTAMANIKAQEFDLSLLLYPAFVALAILSVRSLKKKKTKKQSLRRIPRRY